MNIEPGRYNTMKIARITGSGAFLDAGTSVDADDILLPGKQIPEGAEPGDEVLVFIYRDSEDRLIATTAKPYLAVGECGVLEVAQTTRIGAFLDWGLDKDLFLPFDEQRGKIHAGDKLYVGVYLDKSERLCATMDVYRMLRTDSKYGRNDNVEGIVYNINERIGAFVAVDGKYHGLIPKNDINTPLECCERVEARVKQRRRDGKLILSLRKAAYKAIEPDSETILKELKKNGGFIPYHDKSSADKIKRKFHMSKSAFKRAVGRLYRDGKIETGKDGITLVNKRKK